MVEGARLECVYAVIPYRGFESHPLRQPSLFKLRLAYASKTAESEIRTRLPYEALAKEGRFRKREMFYVYLIQSETFPEQRYIGFTTDLKSASIPTTPVVPCTHPNTNLGS